MPYKFKGVLRINKLSALIKIGVSEKERFKAQEILIDVEIQFSSLSKACINDRLEDTICYDDLSQKIITFCQNKNFNLIEFLASEILKLVNQVIPNNKVKITVYKKAPIKNLQDYVSFTAENQ